MRFADRLAAAVRNTGSITCVGLDPRQSQLPAPLLPAADHASPAQWADAYQRFCCGIIDAVAGMVPCVKPQAAFFEALGPPGMQALANVIQHARHANLLVITDAKRNDIGTTATAYADAYLGAASPWGSDSLTVSPYLGRDSLEPFVEVCDPRDAGIFVLVKTSNPGGGLFQDRKTDGQTLYRAVAQLLVELNHDRVGACGYGPVGAVVGATYPEQLHELRQAMPTSWILIPGFGAQGGGAADVMPGLDSNGLGAIVNNSRNLIFAHSRPEFRDRFGEDRWQDAVAQATREMNDQLKR